MNPFGAIFASGNDWILLVVLRYKILIEQFNPKTSLWEILITSASWHIPVVDIKEAAALSYVAYSSTWENTQPNINLLTWSHKIKTICTPGVNQFIFEPKYNHYSAIC